MPRYNKKNRAIVSGILVGIASIYAIASHFDLSLEQLNGFLVSTVLFFLVIIGLAAITLLVIKGVGRVVRGPPQASALLRERNTEGTPTQDADANATSAASDRTGDAKRETAGQAGRDDQQDKR